MAELTDEQKTQYAAIQAKLEKREPLSSEELTFLDDASEALDSIPAESQEESD